MKRLYSFSAIWRKQDIEFLQKFKLSKSIEVGIDSFYVEEEHYQQIMEHYSKKNSLFDKTKPKEFRFLPAAVVFDKNELENAKSYTLHLGSGKLQYYWDDADQWKSELYGGLCHNCDQPIGEQQKTWVLKRDFKNLEKHPFVGFEGLGGFVFCGKELANIIQKEFGIGQMEVLIGKKRKVSEHLVQLRIPVAPYPLNLEGNAFGKPYEGNNAISCPTCGQGSFTNQKLDFFPPFKNEFSYDMVLTQEWFGWYRRIVVSRRFMDFCFERKILKKWGHAGVVVPQK